MMTTLIEKIVGDLGDKRRRRQYKARVKALPASHRTTAEALERYLTHFGVITKGDVPVDVVMSMLEDLAGLFEQAAADGNPIRAVVGEAPVEFAETFFRNYSRVLPGSRAGSGDPGGAGLEGLDPHRARACRQTQHSARVRRAANISGERA